MSCQEPTSCALVSHPLAQQYMMRCAGNVHDVSQIDAQQCQSAECGQKQLTVLTLLCQSHWSICSLCSDFTFYFACDSSNSVIQISLQLLQLPETTCLLCIDVASCCTFYNLRKFETTIRMHATCIVCVPERNLVRDCSYVLVLHKIYTMACVWTQVFSTKVWLAAQLNDSSILTNI